MLNNITLLSPKTVLELIFTMSKYKDNFTLFAGGTSLMRQSSFYPDDKPENYISLEKIPELHKVIHSDKYIEVGSMVTIQQLLNSGSHIFSKNLVDALENIGTTIMRNQITVGGALCTPTSRYALSCILCALKAQVEIKIVSSSLFSKMKVKSVWLPADKLYDEKGSLIYSSNAVLTRVRIPVKENSIQHFSTIGSPLHSPDSAVIMALEYSISQESINSPSFCLSFINNGLFVSPEFENNLKSLKFPISAKTIKNLSAELKKLMKTTCPSANEIQLERAGRILIFTLLNANSEYLGS